jgi:hypothetical protein
VFETGADAREKSLRSNENTAVKNPSLFLRGSPPHGEISPFKHLP